MAAELIRNSYGKGRVRVSKIRRGAERHDFVELDVNVELMGDFADTYLTGDNSTVVATDSIKNTVYVLANEDPMESIEEFAKTLTAHFVGKYDQVTRATAVIRESIYRRMEFGGKPHPHAFTGGGSEIATTKVVLQGGGAPRVISGLDGLMVLKTTDSGFVGYVKDEFTALPETTDRIFATVVEADWTYTSPKNDWNQCRRQIRGALLETFAHHKSLSVQQTLHEMGKKALEACDCIEEIALTMPNKHHLPVDLSRFGRENKNEIFQPVDEPFGLIRGTVARK